MKNIRLINELATSESCVESFRIIVSDNHSSDTTLVDLQQLKNEVSVEIIVFSQSENIGLERNAVFVLSQATNDFILFLGDDDYLPPGYLSYILEKIETEPELSSIIPGFSALYFDGSIRSARYAKFEEKKYTPSFYALLALSSYGHQLSGLLLRRPYLLEAYTKQEHLRNIYPFIFFVSFNCLRGVSYYVPKFQVLVSQNNQKHWSYDGCGLLTEVMKNYRILYPSSPSRRLGLNATFCLKQYWRLGIKSPLNAIRAYINLMSSKFCDTNFKLILPLIYMLAYCVAISAYLKKLCSR
ncbi:glycosyltransferase [Methylococcus sp. ANG]